MGRRVAELLDHIVEGFRYDEGLDLDKLTVARNYGPHLLELKSISPHREFMKALRERYPRVSYAKCNRWMFIARRENEVQLALERHPGVAWGLKRMLAYLTGRWSPESGMDAESVEGPPADDSGNEDVESADRIQANEDGSGPGPGDDERTGDGADSDIDSVQQAEEKPQDGTNVPDKKYKKLMGRFNKGGDMHKGGKTKAKTAQPPGYRVTVVTPEKGDLEKFGALLPSPITDLNAHSVTAWVGAQGIASTTASVVSTLTTSNLKKVRIVVEL